MEGFSRRLPVCVSDWGEQWENGQSAGCRIRTGFPDNRQLANEFSKPMKGWWEKLKPLNWLKVGLAKLFFIRQVFIGDVLDFGWTWTSRVSMTVHHKIETISRKLRQRKTAVWGCFSYIRKKQCEMHKPWFSSKLQQQVFIKTMFAFNW